MEGVMSGRSQLLEQLFEALLMDEGGPMATAHVMAETSGFTFDGEEEITGHMDELYAVGIVSQGIVAVNMSREDRDAALIKDRVNEHMIAFYMPREAIERLVKDLGELIQREEP
jgi:hypothetical protein